MRNRPLPAWVKATKSYITTMNTSEFHLACCTTGKLVLIAGLLVAGINGAFFTSGYWLNADDVMFLQFFIEGPEAIIDALILYARHQGRIGQHVLMALNILGAGLADKFLFRMFYVAAFFLSAYLFLRWFEIVSRHRVATVAFLLVAALTPLHFYHLPPTSFPLQNSIPFILLILSRLVLLRARKAGRHQWTAAWALSVFSLTMALTEYAFLLGSGMLAVEYLFQLSRSKSISRAVNIFRSWRFVQDIITCLVPLIIYLVWRLLYPSAYDGNSLDGFLNPALALRVWLQHAFGLNYIVFPEGVAAFGSTTQRTVPSLLTGIITGLVIYKITPQLAKFKRPLISALLAVFFALYVTFPTSMTEKQQQWCSDFGSCVFLDSRIAFPSSILALIFISAFLLSVARKLRLLSFLLRIGIPLAAAGSTVITLSHNAWMSDHMKERMIVWDNANRVSCKIDPNEVDIQAYIDPQSVIDIHPHIDANEFWRIYLRDAARNCSVNE